MKENEIKGKEYDMMKATDLMNGDWVKIVDDAPTMPGEYHRVDWIRTGELGLDNRKIVTYPFIEPIHLTPKILEKNGFSDYDSAGAWRWFLADDESYYFGFSSVYYDTKDNLLNVVRENKKGAQNQCKGNYKYVHELQHALKLCGIDKEIIL